MHELSIALSIVEMVEEEAQRRGVRVKAVHMKLGDLAGVVAEALLSSYELATENTNLVGTHLLIERLPILAECPICAKAQPVESMQSLVCRECGTPASDIVQGRELVVSALEVQ